MTAHEFGQRMHDHVGAIVDRTQQNRRGNRVIDNQWHAMSMRDPCQALDVADIAGRVADAFTEYGPSVVVNQCFDGMGLIAFGKPRFDALLAKHMREQGVGRTVELGYRDDVPTAIGEVNDGKVKRRLTSADSQSRDTALKIGDAPLQYGIGRIVDPAIAKAFDLEIE
jgi:hypothetical protein